MADREKKRGKWKYKKNEDLKNESNFLDEISIVHNYLTGFSMSILCVGNISLMQRGFFKNSTCDLLPSLRFLDGLYNFCDFVIVFSLM